MSTTNRIRLWAACWLVLAALFMRLGLRADPPAHWRFCILAGFFATCGVGLLLRVAWTYYALLTFLLYRSFALVARIIAKLLGRYEGPFTMLQLVRFLATNLYAIVDLLEHDLHEEFRTATPTIGDHAVCAAAGVAPLVVAWLRSY